MTQPGSKGQAHLLSFLSDFKLLQREVTTSHFEDVSDESLVLAAGDSLAGINNGMTAEATRMFNCSLDDSVTTAQSSTKADTASGQEYSAYAMGDMSEIDQNYSSYVEREETP